MEITDRGGFPSLVFFTASLSHGSDGSDKKKKSCSPETVHGNRGLGEHSVDVVDGNRVVGVGRITADVDDDAQPAILSLCRDELTSEERRDWCREVDAVDEKVDIQDLLKRTALGCLRHIPLENIIPGGGIRRSVYRQKVR
jgi:hypothetical protein